MADGRSGETSRPPNRQTGRNSEWVHANMEDVISMPDKWEYPWFAAWDWAFHLRRRWPISIWRTPRTSSSCCAGAGTCIPTVSCRPMSGISAMSIRPSTPGRRCVLSRLSSGRRQGRPQVPRDVFTKLLLNFTWWVNRKDPRGLNVFQGGFLAWTISGASTAPHHARRGHAGAVRRHLVDGDVQPQHAAHRHRVGAQDDDAIRTSPPSSSSIS